MTRLAAEAACLYADDPFEVPLATAPEPIPCRVCGELPPDVLVWGMCPEHGAAIETMAGEFEHDRAAGVS